MPVPGLHTLLADKIVQSHNPKTDVVVPVIRVVPVTIGDAGVVLIVVPRTAAQRRSFGQRPIKHLRLLDPTS